MSIGVVSIPFIDRVSAVVDHGEPPRAGNSTAEHRPRGGQRHQLVESMFSVLGASASRAEPQAEQAVSRFAYALMHDLRRVGGDDEDAALAHHDWLDLTARLNALARAAAGGAVAGAAQSLTAGGAAALMQVPSSRLIEAFVAMRRAMSADCVEPGNGDVRSALAQFLQQLAADTARSRVNPSGALLDTKV